MGAKYNWKFFNIWIEFTPSMYIRINRLENDSWQTKYEKWWA